MLENVDTETKSVDKLEQVYLYDRLYLKDIASVRLHHALASVDVFTLKELIAFIKKNGERHLLKIRNFGRTSLDEIYQILGRFGISIDNINYIEEITEQTSSVEEMPVSSPGIGIPYISINSLNISSRAQNILASMQIFTTKDLVEYCYIHNFADLKKMRNIGVSTLDEIMNLLAIIQNKNRWHELMSLCGNSEEKLQICVLTNPFDNLFPSFNEAEREAAYELLQSFYTSALKDLSARTRHIICEYLPSFKDVLSQTSVLSNGEYKRYRNCGGKTWKEIEVFAGKIYKEIARIRELPIGHVATAQILNNLSFLDTNQEDREFIVSFYSSNGYYPMFYILSKLIVNSNDRYDILYRQTTGIMCSPTHIRDVAKMQNISYERVRQILSKNRFSNRELMESELWIPYHLDTLQYLSEDNDLYHKVIATEHLDGLSFDGFCSLCNLISPFKKFIINGHTYFFSKSVYGCFDVKSSFADIETTLNKRVTKDISIPVSAFVNEYWIDTAPYYASQIVSIIEKIITDNFDVCIDQQHNITLFQNTIDVGTELYSIIEDNGSPMNIEEIFDVFKSKFPDHRYANSSALRPHLIGTKGICPIGKTSCYSIDKWNLYTGTIRDLIFETLETSDRPLTAEELLPYIQTEYDTTPKSIRSTVVSDKSGKFCFFKNGYIGIAGKSYDSQYCPIIRRANNKLRRSFNESLEEFERYLQSHHHIPISTGTEEEQVLYRWYNNVINKCLALTPEKEADFEAMISRNADYMVNGTEYAFFRRCDDYKVFLEENMELPNNETDAALYNWFLKNLKIYSSFEDRRKVYFSDLLEYIEAYGFVVNC